MVVCAPPLGKWPLPFCFVEPGNTSQNSWEKSGSHIKIGGGPGFSPQRAPVPPRVHWTPAPNIGAGERHHAHQKIRFFPTKHLGGNRAPKFWVLGTVGPKTSHPKFSPQPLLVWKKALWKRRKTPNNPSLGWVFCWKEEKSASKGFPNQLGNFSLTFREKPGWKRDPGPLVGFSFPHRDGPFSPGNLGPNPFRPTPPWEAFNFGETLGNLGKRGSQPVNPAPVFGGNQEGNQP